VEIADITNGNRLETYAIAGEAGSGIICLNGAAAKLVNPGDKIIIMAYANMTPEEAKSHKPTVIFVDDNNAITRKANYEKHGLLC
jgi:aspartate 1-decarboxylase